MDIISVFGKAFEDQTNGTVSRPESIQNGDDDSEEKKEEASDSNSQRMLDQHITEEDEQKSELEQAKDDNDSEEKNKCVPGVEPAYRQRIREIFHMDVAEVIIERERQKP